MTAIKLNSIEGLVRYDFTVEKDGCRGSANYEQINTVLGWIREKEITMDREKLAKAANFSCSQNDNCFFCRQSFIIADAIIANQSQIIKAVV